MAKPLRWFAASAILYFKKRTRRRQSTFVVWENVYLVRARSVPEAKRLAARFARAAAHNDDDDTRINGQPANLVFGGIRKIVDCLGDPTIFKSDTVTRIHSGVEATYSSFLVKSRGELERLIHGESAKVVYES